MLPTLHPQYPSIPQNHEALLSQRKDLTVKKAGEKEAQLEAMALGDGGEVEGTARSSQSSGNGLLHVMHVVKKQLETAEGESDSKPEEIVSFSLAKWQAGHADLPKTSHFKLFDLLPVCLPADTSLRDLSNSKESSQCVHEVIVEPRYVGLEKMGQVRKGH